MPAPPPRSPRQHGRHVTEADREAIRRYAISRFPRLIGTAVWEKVCLYTSTESEGFIIDSIPGLARTHLISACSGHGFKLTPLLGEIAHAPATESGLPYDLARFRLTNC